MRAFVRALATSVALVAIASCGSRTGLFLDDPSVLPPDIIDAAGIDVQDIRDARADRDAEPDVRDATIDAIDDGPLACVPGTFTLELATPQLMFVLDRSGSMEFA